MNTAVHPNTTAHAAPPPTAGGDGPHARAPKPAGEVYARHVPALAGTLTLSVADARADLALFHAWMNQPRVARYWQEAGDIDHHCRYLEHLAGDAHAVGLIARVNGTPAAYFQMYWTAEDRLAAHYDAHPFDRGVHMLIGARDFLGGARSAALVSAAVDYVLRDEPRTGAVYGEPDHRNTAMIRLARRCGFRVLARFDFPHKRAALLRCRRADFTGRYLA